MDSGASPVSATSIAPWLSVRDGARAVAFYKSAFEATEVYRFAMVRELSRFTNPHSTPPRSIGSKTPVAAWW